MLVAEGRGHVYCKQRCPELPRGLPAGDPEEAEEAGSRCEPAVASSRPQGVGSQKRRIETAGLHSIASEPRGGWDGPSWPPERTLVFQFSEAWLLAGEKPAQKIPPARSCQFLCGPVDCSPPGSSVHRISQARIQEWVAVSSSRGFSPPRDWTWVSCIGRRIFHHSVTWQALILHLAKRATAAGGRKWQRMASPEWTYYCLGPWPLP